MYYLEHHGILGMQWGHRNGPPYPLGMGKHSASEKKAGWKKSLSTQGHSNFTIRKPELKPVENAPQASSSQNNNSDSNQQPQKTEKRYHDALKEARREDPHDLSNQELRDYNDRLRLERDFNDLRRSKVEKVVKDYAKQAFDRVVFAAVVALGYEFVKKQLSKQTG